MDVPADYKVIYTLIRGKFFLLLTVGAFLLTVMSRLQSELCTKIFDLSHEFSYDKFPPKFPPSLYSVAFLLAQLSGTKNQRQKRGSFGPDISLRTSGQKLRSGPPNPGKTSILGRHPARTSMKKLRLFTRPFFLFAPFAGHPSSSLFLGTF